MFRKPENLNVEQKSGTLSVPLLGKKRGNQGIVKTKSGNKMRKNLNNKKGR